MLDKSFFSRERFNAPDLAEKVMARWGVVYRGVDSLHASELHEHGPGLLEPSAAPIARHDSRLHADQRREAIQAAQIGSNVFGIEAYRERRAEAEDLGRHRMMEQAREQAEQARMYPEAPHEFIA